MATAVLDGLGDQIEYRIGHVAANGIFPTFGANQSLDHVGGELGDIAWWHQEHGGDVRSHVAVDVAHDALVFVIVRGADAAQDEAGVHFFGVVDQVAVVEVGDFEPVEMGSGFLEELQTLFDAKGVAFGGIVSNSHDEFIEHGDSLFDHPDVTFGWRIEGSGVDGGAHGGVGKMKARPIGFEPMTVRLEGGLTIHKSLVISGRILAILSKLAI